MNNGTADSTENLPLVKCKLVGEDGNAFAILGRFKTAAKKAGWTNAQIDTVVKDAMSGEYSHLLATVAKYCENGGYDDEDEEY